MTKLQPRHDAIDRNAMLTFGSFDVSGCGRGLRLETDRRQRQG